jgi:hypothetical protein
MIVHQFPSCWRRVLRPGPCDLATASPPAARWSWIWDTPARRTRRIVVTPPELSPPTPHELRLLLGDLATSDPVIASQRTLTAVTVVDRMHVATALGNARSRPWPSELPAVDACRRRIRSW